MLEIVFLQEEKKTTESVIQHTTKVSCVLKVSVENSIQTLKEQNKQTTTTTKKKHPSETNIVQTFQNHRNIFFLISLVSWTQLSSEESDAGIHYHARGIYVSSTFEMVVTEHELVKHTCNW